MNTVPLLPEDPQRFIAVQTLLGRITSPGLEVVSVFTSHFDFGISPDGDWCSLRAYFERIYVGPVF